MTTKMNKIIYRTVTKKYIDDGFQLTKRCIERWVEPDYEKKNCASVIVDFTETGDGRAKKTKSVIFSFLQISQKRLVIFSI